MSGDILLSSNRGLSVNRRSYDALLERARELVSDDTSAVAVLDDALAVGIWAPEDDPREAQALVIPALQRATREALLELRHIRALGSG